ncbi:MAG: DUF4062 domain-containing protein [Ginsengibacter sp.]
MPSIVYISSTYQDLKEHREKVIDFFQKFPDKFELISMEGYMAENITPLARCLQDVASSNIYILILAKRYGYIPGDNAANPKRYSITQLEYETARKAGKQVLVFIANDQIDFTEDNDENLQLKNEKREKLKIFKQQVRTDNLTHPEPFVSPDSLTIQVSESLMKKLFLEYKIADQRKLCCNRSPQFNDYLQNRRKSRFKAFVIHGARKELGRNLINRFSVFTLNAGIKNVLPYHRFQEFMQNDYEKSEEKFIVNILQKSLQVYEVPDTNFTALIKKIEEFPYSSFIIVLQCNEQFLTQTEITFLCRFLKNFYDAAKLFAKKEVYFFLNVEDENSNDTSLKEKTNPLETCNTPSESYIFSLPRLKRETIEEIEDWISTYVTGDQLIIDQLLEKYFTGFQAEFTMTEAEKSIQQMMQKINSGEEDIFKY